MLRRIKFSLSIVLGIILLTSCGKYNRVLNKGNSKERYSMANDLYKKESYDKSIRLYELVLPSYESKPQKEVIVFRLGNANYNTEDYTTAIYYYEKFLRSFPKSTELEEGQFKIAECYYQLSPKYSVSQTDTEKAIEAYQTFIDKNPDSERIVDANSRIKELNYKLETKSFEIAKQYYKIGNYKSAIVAFDNVILDFLGTRYKEQAMFYKFKAAYELGVNSVYYKKEARIKEAIKVYTRYKKAFPSSEYLKEADDLYNKLLKESQPKQQQNS